MTNNMLSQEEIDALLKGELVDNIDNNNETVKEKEELTETEKDALGEIGNISMGTAATTLYTLLGKKVIITTPKVEVTNTEELSKEYVVPFVAVDVKYKLGLEGSNLLILKTDDVKVITDLMMGGDGTNIDRELNEMDLSAISEAMNQMVGSSSTSLSEMFSTVIDIEPPRAFLIKLNEDNIDLDVFKNKTIVKISFRMIIGDLIDSEIMQLLPIDFAKNIVSRLLGQKSDLSSGNSNENMDLISQEGNEKLRHNNESKNSTENLSYNVNNEEIKKQEHINVRKVEFQSFDENKKIEYNESIDLIQEIPVEVTVELGRTTKKISEILEFGPGTVIELDKLVGEPLEIFANGKFIAKGEVVVIDDNFGVRITDVVNPSKRASKI
ncbi:flagellar motor switch protein FliN [Caloranaerobacter azorensis H53214]|uniref:Flagellar motor switch protein FliN n=1 Tax=Caloranaerobacter azorensis H53214 TaxID=1156417 RepID=A0A096BHT1_9FIRM|nr:flagellar motor switch phosphatase FliY [Caloranaerobacter azorensis]KGG80745.1 flagellar motor switch protein FliN [Caloranaerobacter azorensis H53214]